MICCHMMVVIGGEEWPCTKPDGHVGPHRCVTDGFQMDKRVTYRKKGEDGRVNVEVSWSEEPQE